MNSSIAQRLVYLAFPVSLLACVPRPAPVRALACGGDRCVSPGRMAESLHAQLDGKVVGFAYVIGAPSAVSGGGGLARTAADGPTVAFTPRTRITTASVSKWITAIATMSVLQAHRVGLDDPIGPFLPSDWTVDPYVRSITFGRLLSHTSGIKDFGNGPQPYERLRAFFTRGVDGNSTTRCAGARVSDPPNAITPGDVGRCYSNYNFAILRLLLPRVAGFAEDADPGTRPRTLADQYESLVQKHVFRAVGATAPACRPTRDDHARAYFFPGDKPGHDWGDVRLRCGDAGWYVTADEMASVLLSVVARDGRILAESESYSSYAEMRRRGLGVDINTPELMAKSGLWGDDGGLISTTAAIFGPEAGPNLVAVLFINSDVAGAPGARAQGILEGAYAAASGN